MDEQDGPPSRRYANEAQFRQRMAEILELNFTNWDMERFELSKYTQSPIETAMGEGLVSAMMLCGFHPPIIVRPGERFSDVDRVQIAPQFRIGSYRADFAVVDRHYGPKFHWIVVECDGHDYHERTKEQARHDKARDRFFVAQGWTVLRFTGSEIHADAGACADQVADLINGEHSRPPQHDRPPT